MSILIADAGATSTSWAIIKGEEQQVIRTSGINPTIKVDAEIESVLFDELGLLINTSAIQQVFFYGAGCGTYKEAERVKKKLGEVFRNKEIYVATDLAGAGLSVFDQSRGIVCISGTGSSAGFMEGGALADVMPTKAYPEGDFGSGSHIGALILKDYLAEKSPKSIMKILDENRRLSIDELFVHFQDPKKSKLIASKALRDVATSPDFKNPAHQNYIDQQVWTSLDKFFGQLKNHFKNALIKQPIRYVGSTVYVFEDQFRKYFKNKGILLDEVVRSPIHGLVRYHLNKDD